MLLAISTIPLLVLEAVKIHPPRAKRSVLNVLITP